MSTGIRSNCRACDRERSERLRGAGWKLVGIERSGERVSEKGV